MGFSRLPSGPKPLPLCTASWLLKGTPPEQAQGVRQREGPTQGLFLEPWQGSSYPASVFLSGSQKGPETGGVGGHGGSPPA